MRVTLFDHGAGNLHSLAKALVQPRVRVRTETDPFRALETDLLVLPGVGAFGPAAARLAPARDAIRDALRNGLPCIGICLGMQLLFDSSEEGDGSGLGVFAGRVRRLRGARVPHMGWNGFEQVSEPLLAHTGLGTAYFAHSFVAEPSAASCVMAWTRHEDERFPAVVRDGRTLGVQFHPEKSSRAGVAFLRRALLELAAGASR